jgi:hypothetical protein
LLRGRIGAREFMRAERAVVLLRGARRGDQPCCARTRARCRNPRSVRRGAPFPAPPAFLFHNEVILPLPT